MFPLRPTSYQWKSGRESMQLRIDSVNASQAK